MTCLIPLCQLQCSKAKAMLKDHCWYLDMMSKISSLHPCSFVSPAFFALFSWSFFSVMCHICTYLGTKPYCRWILLIMLDTENIVISSLTFSNVRLTWSCSVTHHEERWIILEWCFPHLVFILLVVELAQDFPSVSTYKKEQTRVGQGCG